MTANAAVMLILGIAFGGLGKPIIGTIMIGISIYLVVKEQRKDKKKKEQKQEDR